MTVRSGYIILGSMVTCETILMSYVVVVMQKLDLHAKGMVHGMILQWTLVPGVGVTGWKRTRQYLLNSYGRNLSLK